jgi:integrase
LAIIAKYWLDLPKDHIEVLGRFSRRLAPSKQGLSSKSKTRLIPFRDETNIVRLFLLPNRLREAVTSGEIKGRHAALRIQQAVALSILTYCPLRIGNLAALELDRHLRWTQPGMSGKLFVLLSGTEVKNDIDLAYPLPKECAELVRIYVRDYRDGLCLPSSSFLFPGRNPNKSKQPACLGMQIRELTHDSIGFPCPPHLYRHIVHLVVLRKFPSAFGMISRILGHKSLETTLVNYAHEATSISMQTYQHLVSDVLNGHWTLDAGGDTEFFANAANEGLF